MSCVLFVCTGNTCRSPMACALANEHFKKNGITSHIFMSRGVSVSMPSGAEPNAVHILNTVYGIDLSQHISKQLTADDLHIADCVITMTNAHKNYLASLYPSYSEKITTLYDLSGIGTGDVDDPFGGSIDVYEQCAALIKDCISRITFDTP